MRSVGRAGLISLLFLVSLLPVGCGGGPVPTDIMPTTLAALALYPVRSDLMVAAKGDLGAPSRWSSSGCPPLRGLRLGDHSPDPELFAQLRPKMGKDILDPVAGLTPNQRDTVGRLLDKYFGTPAAPTVRLISATDAAKLKLDEMFNEAPGKAPKDVVAALVREAATAHAAINLDDGGLARGSILYRRWCQSCHGPTGGGETAYALRGAAMPRDYRRGLFKFVTCYPTGAPQSGELGKPRQEDLKRTIHNGLDGSMMPPFPQITGESLDDLARYVMHLSIRGEAEFEVISRVIQPLPEDLEYSAEFTEQMLAVKLLSTVGNWGRAETTPIPIPPEPATDEAARLESAARGYKSFMGTCAGCHQDFGRVQQLKFDMWGTVVQPRNLTLGVYRGGRRGEDLYARVYAGIYPSTMPDSKAKAATTPGRVDEIWDIVHFLQALPDPRQRMLLMQFDPSIKIE